MVLDFKVNWRARRRETFRSRFFVPVSIGRNPYLLQRLLPFQRQFDLSEHTIKITSSCKSYSFVILRLHNDREEGAASKSLGFRCR